MILYKCMYVIFTDFESSCYILTRDRAVNQRCTCVNKQKKKRKQVDVMKEYMQMLSAVESFGDRKSWVRTSLQTENAPWGLLTLATPGWATPGWATLAKMRKSAKCVLEDNIACYGQEKKMGQYSSLSMSPSISHTPQKHQPFRE